MMRLNKFIILFLFLSCGKYEDIKFRPKLYLSDYINNKIIYKNNDTNYVHNVYCSEEEFNNYICMDKDDLKKIVLILKNGKVKRQYQKEVDFFINNLKERKVIDL